MLKETMELLQSTYGLKEQTVDLYNKAIKDVEESFKLYDDIREFNQLKVLASFKKHRVSDSHFTNSTGYGYGDIGRDTLDEVYADIFKCEKALVRPHFVSGTHAIGTALFGNLRPGDTILLSTGTPYDTLHTLIGINKTEKVGSLKEYGVAYKQVDLVNNKIDIESVKKVLREDKTIKIVHMQRSTGYGWRNAFLVEELGAAIKEFKSIRPDVLVFVDNCYGEFLDTKEPTEVGADLMAGSLIKNIGGGMAQSGGYIVGKAEYVDQASYRLTVPGVGGECGATFNLMREIYQGLFMAPHISMEAVKGAIFCARIMELAGFEVLPKYTDRRSDIIQAIKFNDRQKLIDFCKGIQKASPVDSFVECEPWAMPGYDDEVIMAAGGFIQGSSIELSADAPLRAPYIAYLQGGLTFDHAKTGVLVALNSIL
ncbi:methionine gamma-lyase family protein [uncultured Clostridium sp.]|uniref:methionine gamma-lyase family protein n=1 Tax=uncultured Clostridium sp. TaxID=59620 RepID=UPI00262E9973|nr:methionine gamma-lyase family protein [uncultured Clostridium sp.]